LQQPFSSPQSSREKLHHGHNPKRLVTMADVTSASASGVSTSSTQPKPPISRLPDENLLQAFRFLRDDELSQHSDPNDDGTDPIYITSENIKNVRLVCRRFRDASSELLFPTFTVEPTTQSVTRLEQIANNPLLSSRVEAVRIVSTAYELYATTYWGFQRFCQDQIRRMQDTQRTLTVRDASGRSFRRARNVPGALVLDKMVEVMKVTLMATTIDLLGHRFPKDPGSSYMPAAGPRTPRAIWAKVMDCWNEATASAIDQMELLG
jgi:hypothetical protein